MNDSLNIHEDPKLPHEEILKHSNPFIVPNAYFTDLTDGIIVRAKQDEFLNKINPTIFKLPADYFTKFPDHILDRIHKENKIEQYNSNVFQLPVNYFENLTNRIMDRIEKEAIPQELNQNVFKVPNGYFENFSDKVLSKIKLKQNSKIIPGSFKKLWVFSAAASFVIVISWFVMNLYNTSTHVDYLAASSEEELLEYVSTYSNEFEHQSLASILNEDELNSLEIMETMDDETSDFIIELFE
ncbi:MAG: hypothetical protein IPO78_00730 [Saprospiraceae bacterium]|nr:hypothetical protein [Saprospiraceae bacterium]MBK9720125.1 hypothetical protein [Saprospiraceae bacterium]MBK9727119.1 hypothetical protein [Saprospiraceae bacterium]